MRHKNIRYLVSGALFVILLISAYSFTIKTNFLLIKNENLSAIQILHQMIDSVDNIKTLKVKLEAIRTISR